MRLPTYITSTNSTHLRSFYKVDFTSTLLYWNSLMYAKLWIGSIFSGSPKEQLIWVWDPYVNSHRPWGRKLLLNVTLIHLLFLLLLLLYLLTTYYSYYTYYNHTYYTCESMWVGLCVYVCLLLHAKIPLQREEMFVSILNFAVPKKSPVLDVCRRNLCEIYRRHEFTSWTKQKAFT